MFAQGGELVSWVMDRVNKWESKRDLGYGKIWAEYWRMWRGKWSTEDKNRDSERSRIITPAIAQAVEATVSEIEEAIFSRDIWFDVADSEPAQGKDVALQSRDRLQVDLDRVNAKDALSEAILNGAIFGTGVVQINVNVGHDSKPIRDPVTKALSAQDKERVFVPVESIRPDEFIPDPSGKSIHDMLGCAVKRVRPQHSVLEKIQAGVYLKSALGEVTPQPRQINRDIDQEVDPQSYNTSAEADEVIVVEYHGKVPLGLLNQTKEAKTELDRLLDSTSESDSDDEKLVEAIVTIANGRTLLRAIVNPYTMKDRSIIAFQFERVPGRFWGRGVIEKGYNPQKALDATVRAYIDSLGYVAAPMLGIDSGRIPRGLKMDVHPGKTWLTQGPPGEVLSPVKFGDINPALFQQASEMERMVQMGTGAFDTAAALNNQSQSGAAGATSSSMMMGAFVKRAKRSIQNVDRNLLTPVVTKVLWRYMQFDPARYPASFDFQIKTSMGIVAREVENMQIVQLVGMVGDAFPQIKLLLAQSIVENTAANNKTQILTAVAQALAPPDPQTVQFQQQMQQEQQHLQLVLLQAQAQGALLDNQVKIATVRELLSRAAMEAAKSQVTNAEIGQEQQKIAQEQQNIDNFSEQNRIAAASLFIDNKKAEAALISAKKKPSGTSQD